MEKIKRRPFLAYLTAGEAAKKGKKTRLRNSCVSICLRKNLIKVYWKKDRVLLRYLL